MNFSDHWVTDANGTKFVFKVEDQRQLSEMGLPVTPDSLAELVPSQSAQPNAKQSSQPKKEHGQSAEKVTPSQENDAVPEDDDFEEPATIQIDPLTGKYLGRIKWYNFTKGYGFIARGAGEDIFFHKTDIQVDPQELDRGVWVLYDVEETDKGFEASDVELAEEQP